MSRAASRKRGTSSPHQPELSPETIRTAALALIDDEGLTGFSTRKLGRALGCEAMAIYWYFPSKDALLDAVVDKLMEDVALVISTSRKRDWIAVLRAVAIAYRGVAHAHPKAFPLLATRRFASETTFEFLEQLFALAREQGIDDHVTAWFYRVVSSYCNGFALNELAGSRDVIAKTGGKRFARVTAVSAWLEPKYLDELFDFGLELQLAALARATRSGRVARPR